MQEFLSHFCPLSITIFILFYCPDVVSATDFSGTDTSKAHLCYIGGMGKIEEGSNLEAMDLFEEASRRFQKKKFWERAIVCDLRKTDAWTSTSDKTGLIEFWIETVQLSEKTLGLTHPITGDCYNRLGELYYLENKNQRAQSYFDKAMEVYSICPGERALDKAKVYTNYGRLKMALSQYDSVEHYLDQAQEMMLNQLDTLDRRLLTTYHTYGTFYYHIGKMDQSIHYNQLVLEMEKIKYGEVHPDIADCYNNLGGAYQRKGEFEKSMDIQQRALDIRLTTLDTLHPNVALSYNNLANVYASLGDYEKSDEYHHIALRLRRQIFDENHRDMAMSYANLGSNQLYQGHYTKALEYFKMVIPIMVYNHGPDHMLTADAIENAGLPFYFTGRLDSAFHYLFKALVIREGVQDGINMKVARSYNNIGAIYKENRDYELALSYYFKSMELYKRLFGENTFPLSGSFNNIGEVYYLTGNYEKALEFYLKALEIDIEHLGPDNPKLADRFLNLGSVSSDLGQFEESFAYNEKALQYQIEAYGEKNRLVSSIYANMAMDYDQLDSLERAIEYLKRAIQIREEVSGMSDPELASDYTRLGLLLAKNDLKEEGLRFLHRALSVNYFGEVDPACLWNVDPVKIKDSNQFIETLSSIVRFRTEYLAGNSEKEIWSGNIEFYELIADLSIHLRMAYRFEKSKLHALKQWDYLYSDAFETAANLYKISGDEEYINKAFRFAGLKKASALTDAIMASQAMRNAGVPEQIVQKEDSLNTELESLRQSLMEADDSTEAGSDDGSDAGSEAIKNQINSTVIELNSLYLSIEKQYPKYNSLRLNYPDYTPNEIALLLDSTSLLLDFVVTDSAIYTLVIGKHGKWIEHMDVPSDMESRIIELLRSLKKYRINDFNTYSREIYAHLISPLEKYFKGIDKLICIPESYLLLLPLDILICGDKGVEFGDSYEADSYEADYLVKRFETVSHYSTDLWVRSFEKSHSNGTDPDLDEFLAIAPVFNKGQNVPPGQNTLFVNELENDSLFSDRAVVDRMALQELPYSQQEVDSLVAMFRAQGRSAISLKRSEATEENFRKTSGNFRYVHVATHGIINPDKPELSGLVFWLAEDRTDLMPELLISTKSNDGVLYTKEVYSLDLKADLVTLSACETGAGMLVKGEGLLSFVRGFTCAGVPNMLLSYWKLNDKTTAEFMIKFYEGVLSGETYSSALRKAKLSALSNASTAFPASWGNFVLIGY